MRVPIPKDSLLALTLVGAVMTAGLTVALADPAAVDALRRDAADVVAPDEPPAPPAPTTTASPAVVSEPTPTRTVTTAAAAGPAPTVVAATTRTATQTPTAIPTSAPEPVATPTAVASFTPAVQQPPPREADEEFHERSEHEDGEDD